MGEEARRRVGGNCVRIKEKKTECVSIVCASATALTCLTLASIVNFNFQPNGKKIRDERFMG